MDNSSVFKAVDDVLRKPGSGCGNALEYMEQSSWLLFLRYLDAREEERRTEAELCGVKYQPVLPPEFAWENWTHDEKLTGADLLDFVKGRLFPALAEYKNTAAPDTVQQRIGLIFSGLVCRFENGYRLKEVIDLLQPLRFETEEERHEISKLYEDRLRQMGNAGRDGGQYYTPRPLIRVMARIAAPKLGEKVYDGACGSAGFLCEAFDLLNNANRQNANAREILQTKTFYGKEAQNLPYIAAQMNCILHGLESPNIQKTDTLSEKIADYQDSDRVDVILANPPFGADVAKEDLGNFTVRSTESALLFLEHFIAKLKKGGRAAVIIKNTFLSNGDTASKALRKMLLEKCQLHWVLDLPQKVFVNAGVHTVVLFFQKGKPTTKPIRYYQLDMAGVSLGKKRPLLESDLAEFERLATGCFDGTNNAPPPSKFLGTLPRRHTARHTRPLRPQSAHPRRRNPVLC